MAEVFCFDERRRSRTPEAIVKIVDGKMIELIDVDALSPVEWIKYFRLMDGEAPDEESPGAEIVKFTRPA